MPYKNNTYIYTTERSAIYGKNTDIPLDVESFMQMDNHKGIETFILNDNELALSSNAAKQYGLKPGDAVMIKYDFSKKPYMYKLTKIFPAVYDVFSGMTSKKEIAVIGYTGAYLENISPQYVYLAKNGTPVPNAVSLTLDKYFFTMLLKMRGCIYIAVYVTIIAIITMLVFSFANKIIRENYLHRLYYSAMLGLRYSKIILCAMLLGCALFAVPSLVSLLFCAVVYKSDFFSLNTIVLLSPGVIITVVWTAFIIKKCCSQGDFLCKKKH
jgi:hypothetical protein